MSDSTQSATERTATPTDGFRERPLEVVDTWLTDHGLQYVQLRKGQGGDVGSLSVLEYIEEPPFVRAVA